MSTLTLIDCCDAAEGATLTPWRLRGGDHAYLRLADLSALTFTIFRVDGAAGDVAVGATARNGLNAGGVTVSAEGRLTHVITAADNALDATGVSERRKVVYTITHGGLTTKHVARYYLKA